MERLEHKMTLTLTEETWGEAFHRAYRRGRDRYGFSYLSVAEKIKPLVSMSDQMLLRLEKLESEPSTLAQRRVAYLALLAYGYEPESFGLTIENCGLGVMDMRRVRKILSPGPGPKGKRGSSTRSRCSPQETRSTPRAA